MLRDEDIPFLQNFLGNKVLRHWSGHRQQCPLYHCIILDFDLKIQCTFIKLTYVQEGHLLFKCGYGELSSRSLFPFFMQGEKMESRAQKLPYMITLTFRLFPRMNFTWVYFSSGDFNLATWL